MFDFDSTRPKGHGLARKIAVVILGSIVLAFGLALLVLPGPAVVVIPIGLGILATELPWVRGILPRLRSRFAAVFARPAEPNGAVRAGSGLWVAVAMLTVVASFSASLAFSHFRQRHIEDELADILQDEGPGLEHLSAMRTELRGMGRQVNEYIEKIDAGAPASREEIEASRRRLESQVAAYRALPSFPGEPQLIGDVEHRIARTSEAAMSALDEADEGSTWAAHADLRRRFQPRLENAYAAIEHLSVLNSGYVRARAASVLDARRAGLQIENLLGALSVLSAIGATALVLRSLRGRARLMEEHSRVLAARASELEAFAGRVAHDLKNPLAAVVLRVTLARREGLTARLDAHLAKVAHQVQRMNQMIDGLLEFALAGARPPTGTRASLRDVTLDVVNDLLPAAAAADAELRVDAIPATEIACTSGALTSVLSNLVGNAVKYVVDGREFPHRITLRAEDRGDVTRVEVEDNGPGLPAGATQMVFEPFRRLAERQPGIGLGLATVKKIVEAYGGRVGVDATLGHGCSFWFELPNAPANVREGALPVPARDHVSGAAA